MNVKTFYGGGYSQLLDTILMTVSLWWLKAREKATSLIKTLGNLFSENPVPGYKYLLVINKR